NRALPPARIRPYANFWRFTLPPSIPCLSWSPRGKSQQLPPPPDEVRRAPLRFFQLEFAFGFLFFEEGFEFGDGFEQADPLFVIERDGKTPEAVDADAALFSDTEIESAAPFRAGLFLKLRELGF